ncbi:unnamed protein product [Porites lobata]|uniref:Maturase K n=1 Tax=Porites lobata TaxID=104759 RepID=A0ABN8MWX7_9CNID|nr:unnamed protein product [Porites lobata]
MTIDNRLSFDNHVSVICKKINNQFNRIFRFILRDYSSPYGILLSKVNMKSLFIRRLQNFMITSHNIRVCSLRIIQVI